MHIIAWNIWMGGGSRIGEIFHFLAGRDADVLVLGEFQRGTTEPLIHRLQDAGWTHAAVSDPPGRTGGVAIISKTELAPGKLPQNLNPFSFRYLPVRIPAQNIELCAVYGPLQKDPFDKFWTAILEDLEAKSDQPVLVTGDFNSGEKCIDSPAPTLHCSKYFSNLSTIGYSDLWRAKWGADSREYTWAGKVHPYRLDHAFGTRKVAERLRRCTYDHSVRDVGLSDHSLLSIELDGQFA